MYKAIFCVVAYFKQLHLTVVQSVQQLLLVVCPSHCCHATIYCNLISLLTHARVAQNLNTFLQLFTFDH